MPISDIMKAGRPVKKRKSRHELKTNPWVFNENDSGIIVHANPEN